jgi:hypothetical protein
LADRRGRPRFEIVGDLAGTVETAALLEICDVSVDGARVKSAVALQPGAEISVTVEFRGAMAPAFVRVRHVHREAEQTYTAGVEFVSPSRELIALVAAASGNVAAAGEIA